MTTLTTEAIEAALTEITGYEPTRTPEGAIVVTSAADMSVPENGDITLTIYWDDSDEPRGWAARTREYQVSECGRFDNWREESGSVDSLDDVRKWASDVAAMLRGRDEVA